MSISRLKLLGYLAIATTMIPIALWMSPEMVKFSPFRGINQAVAQNRPNTQQQRRIALVIGNANYAVGKLKTPLNDATDMAATLKQLGFEVIPLKDATKRQMEDALDRFSVKLRQGDVGLFYYAGHGMQVQGENYLIPVNAAIKAETDIQYETLPLGKILGRMESAGNGINIVILDACRDNPFRSFVRSSSRGLAIQESATRTLIAFATAPEKVASDGKGRNPRNGLFTSYLLKYIKTPNLDVDLMLRKVRADVVKTTQNYQVPWSSSSLIEEFYFNPTSQRRSTLISLTTGVDYTPLHELLSQKKWKEADQKTWNLVVAAANRQEEGWLDKESVNKFSCEDLRMIDREWLKASGGKFGFSVQLAIYKQTGNPLGIYNEEAYGRFGDAVGWRTNGNWKNYNDLTWGTNAPSVAHQGHLPYRDWRYGGYISPLSLRLVNCSI